MGLKLPEGAEEYEAYVKLKSDQNGIEMCIRRIYLDVADELKSDQNGIEIILFVPNLLIL